MPLHRAVDPGVEYDQAKQGQQRREEEVHVLLVDLRKSVKREKKGKNYLGIHGVVGKSHVQLPVPVYLQHFGQIVHSAAVITILLYCSLCCES